MHTQVNFLTDNWHWIFGALASGAALMWPQLSGGGAGQVNSNEAVQLINREKALVLDVCEPAEFAAGHINGAKNVPLAQIDGTQALPSNKDTPIVVVCLSGMRAGRAASTLRKAGHTRVHVLQGGMNAWREAGLPVSKSA